MWSTYKKKIESKMDLIAKFRGLNEWNWVIFRQIAILAFRNHFAIFFSVSIDYTTIFSACLYHHRLLGQPQSRSRFGFQFHLQTVGIWSTALANGNLHRCPRWRPKLLLIPGQIPPLVSPDFHHSFTAHLSWYSNALETGFSKSHSSCPSNVISG